MRYILAPAAFAFLSLFGSLAHAESPRLDTSDFYAYALSFEDLKSGLTRQEIADLNWQLTLIAYGDKPSSMSYEDYTLAMSTFMMEHQDTWLERLRPYDGWTAKQLMKVPPRAVDD